MSAGSTIVLLYHRIAQLACDPHQLAVSPDRFAQHCEILRHRCTVVPLREAMRFPRQVAITFDDGYADNAGEARRILDAAGLPATFFISVGRIGGTAEAWWDRLAQIVLERGTAAGAIDVEIAGRALWADCRSGAARERAHMALFWRLRPLQLGTIDRVLAEIEEHLDVRRVDRETHRWMSPDELSALAQTDLVDVGAHTLTHPFLATLTAEEQRTEIAGSREQLERLVGRPVAAFAYPYGGPDAFSPTTIRLVAEAGYQMACTAIGGIARAGGDPLQIPRYVVGDWSAEEFARTLDRWLANA